MAFREYFHDVRVGPWRPDTLAAAAGVTLALVLLSLQLFVSNLFLLAIPIPIGVASGLYLLVERRGYEVRPIGGRRLSGRAGHRIRLAVLVGLAGLVFVGTYTGGRTAPFYGVAAVVGALVFVQVLFLERSALGPAVVLLQIVAFALVVRWTALLATPGLIGVDAWVHVPNYASAIRQSGQLAAIADSKYYAAPLYHLLVVVAAEAFNATLRTALYATLGVVVPLAVLLLYYTGRCFLPVRWALFAAAAFGVADHFVRWGIHLIPTSMGLVLFVGVFYGVGRLATTRRTRATYALVLLFAVATVLTHQISAFVLLVFLGVGAVAQLYVRFVAPRFDRGDAGVEGASVNFLGLFLVVLVVTAVDWSAAPVGGSSFLAGMTETARSSIGSAAFLDLASTAAVGSETVAAMVATVPTTVRILDVLGFSLLLFVTLLGAFTLLGHKRHELLPLTWVGSTTLMLFVVIGLPLFGLDFLIPGRWYAFLYVPAVLLAAFGMRYLEVNVAARQFVAVALVLALVFPGAMLVDRKATHDEPLGEDYSHRFAYTESELAAARTIAAIHPEGATIRADDPYALLFRDWKHLDARALALSDDGTVSHEYVVYREYQSGAGTQVRYGGEMVRVPLPAEAVCRPSMDVVYANDAVRYCRGGPR